ncbi:glycosyl hydrolase family 32 [Micromonospora sp. NPDC092111]|uniref:glycosyl hydrolase family 32 n=1 Tax=Micromonospora sp. NPDC092111 TaxID=3364289 RepID=UPI0038099AAE
MVLFYTGVGRAEDGLVQRIGLAVSDDLITWRRHSAEPLVEADPTWYELLDRTLWYEQAWRDPWVFPDPDGHGWHMLITARANTGPADGRGVVGHATSPDLVNWTVRPPLSTPAGFGHLEVPQVAVVDGQPLLLFSTDATGVHRDRHRIWVVEGPSVHGPWDIASARPFPHPHLYAPRLVHGPAEDWSLIGFLDHVDGEFVGELTDPIPVHHRASAGLTVAEPPAIATG